MANLAWGKEDTNNFMRFVRPPGKEPIVPDGWLMIDDGHSFEGAVKIAKALGERGLILMSELEKLKEKSAICPKPECGKCRDCYPSTDSETQSKEIANAAVA